jgi:phasin family protein
MTDETQSFGDVTKMIEQFKLPGVDMSALAEARRKDIEALVEANKTAYDSLQALARKYTEMLTRAVQGMQEVASSAVGGGSGGGGGDPAGQTETVRKAFEKALADIGELAEMVRNSQADTMAHITHRATESMQEITQSMRLR